MSDFQYVSNQLLDVDNDCSDVVIALKPIHYNWYQLGIHLKIPIGTLQSIAGKHNNDHFMQMTELISTWIRRRAKQERFPSWRVLCQSLALMGDVGLAEEIADRKKEVLLISKKSNDLKIETPQLERSNIKNGKDPLLNDNTDKGWLTGKPDHLAILITNTYKEGVKLSPSVKPLPQVQKDRDKLYKTFGTGKLKLIKAEDYTLDQMKQLQTKVSDELRKHDYQSVFIIFSGHGGKDSSSQQPFLVSDDGRTTDVQTFISEYKALIKPSTPKYFLIDACRGPKELPTNKGDDFCLVAFSTEDDHVAKCAANGSYWITKLAKRLDDVRDIHSSDSVVEAVKNSIQDVIDDKTLTYKQTPYIAENGFISVESTDHHELGKVVRKRKQNNGDQHIDDTRPQPSKANINEKVSPWYRPCSTLVVGVTLIVLAAGVLWNWSLQNRVIPQDHHPHASTGFSECSRTTVGAPNDKELMKILSSIPVTNELQTFCVNLDLCRAKCKEIIDDPTIKGNFDSQRHKVLHLWSIKKKRTWKDFVEALHSTGYEKDAKEIAEKYCN